MSEKLNVDAARAAMKAKGLSQTALANSLDVSKEAVSQWLAHKSFPRPNKLLKLAKLLGLGFKEIVTIGEDHQPVVAFRKKQGTKTKNHHVENAKDMGRCLVHLVPYLEVDSLEMPPVLKSPVCEYEYLQKVANKIRADINVGATETIDFPHLIRRFSELQATIIPVLWGKKQRHENAVHILLPESKTTWVYLNLDTNVHDFKFWMAHELGHCLSPSLTGSAEGEDFADALAGALLFSKEKAEQAYLEVKSERLKQAQINRLLSIAEKDVISPYTVLLQINSYARYQNLQQIEPGKGFFPKVARFNESFKDLSEVIFEDLDRVDPSEFISKTEVIFDSIFFETLGNFLRDTKKGPGFVQSVMDMPLLDSQGLHSALT